MLYVFEENYDFLQYTVIHMQYTESFNQIICHSDRVREKKLVEWDEGH